MKPILPTVATVDKSRPIWPASPSGGWASGVERLTSRPTGGRLTATSHYRAAGAYSYPWAIESHGPYTGFMHHGQGVNNWTMPHALPAHVQTQGMGGSNDPSAVPSYTGAGLMGWAKSEFGCVRYVPV